MSEKVIKAVGYANGEPCPFAGQYLVSYDPDAPAADFAWDKDKAKRFPDLEAALAEWNQVCGTDPVREDGKPNKPLTAITVVIDNATEETQ